MKKMLVFDMDETILNDYKEINPLTIETLKKAKNKGFKIAIATGRPFIDIHRFVNFYSIFDYYVCNNGTYYYDVKTSKYHYQKTISKKILTDVFNIAKRYKTFLSICLDGGVFRTKMFSGEPNWLDKDLEEFKKFYYSFVPQETIFGLINNKPVTQISLRWNIPTIREIYQNEFKDKHKEITSKISGRFYLDINPQNTSKYDAIKKIIAIEKIIDKNTYVFGDSNNDIEMLNGFENSFCMENGTNEAKNAASKIIGDNNSNTISLEVEKIINKKD